MKILESIKRFVLEDESAFVATAFSVAFALASIVTISLIILGVGDRCALSAALVTGIAALVVSINYRYKRKDQNDAE